MLDELDAMLAAERAKKPRRRVVVKKGPTKVKISYWSVAEGRFKTRHTTCMFKPTKEDSDE